MEVITAFDKPKEMLSEIEAYPITNLQELEAFRIAYIGSKGAIKGLMGEIKQIPNEQKKAYGQLVNATKQAAEAKYQTLKDSLESGPSEADQDLDLSLPVDFAPMGSRHPINIIRDEIISIFSRIGFDVAEGPEIEDDWHNFTALNIPEDHPARDMQDTFFVDTEEPMVLRTHTSPVQIRTMLNNKPPIRIICPGRVYRCDSDSTHSPVFHQVEGLYVAEKVSFADLKQTLYHFVTQIFGEKTEIRFRPSFFPFTEPSAELDISWIKNEKKSWMEILGCGMIDPIVLENCGIDSEKYMGFAFGMGVERIAMLKYGIKDIRLFYENDIRFLKQFEGA